MKLYRLRVRPGEYDSEETAQDEWFASLATAKRRRAELIRETPADDYPYGSNFEIQEITFAKMPLKRLLLGVLNRRGYVRNREVVVEEYSPRRP